MMRNTTGDGKDSRSAFQAFLKGLFIALIVGFAILFIAITGLQIVMAGLRLVTGR